MISTSFPISLSITDSFFTFSSLENVSGAAFVISVLEHPVITNEEIKVVHTPNNMVFVIYCSYDNLLLPISYIHYNFPYPLIGYNKVKRNLQKLKHPIIGDA